MKCLFLNPHRKDFAFKSPIYHLLGRKSLMKYNYVKKVFLPQNTHLVFLYSSFYSRFKKARLQFLDCIFLYFEIKIFYKINNLDYHKKRRINENYDVVFCFGSAIRELSLKELKKISTKAKKIIIHLSHYHEYANKLELWSKIPNIVFCADVDLRENLFFNYYTIGINKPFYILPFEIKDRFSNLKKWENRESKVISTGTYHKFEEILTNKELKNNLLSRDFGILSLHPERRLVALYKRILPFVKVLNNPMAKSGIIASLYKRKMINQKKYFSINIVEEYNKYKFSFIGEEIIGNPGIGIFESIACGCIPIINKKCYKGTPLDENGYYIGYNSSEELIKILNDSKMLSEFSLDIKKYYETITAVKTFYSSDALSIRLISIIEGISK